jgi:hypothetical protein
LHLPRQSNYPTVLSTEIHREDIMKRLLITGFDPFGGATVNPAWQAVKRLPDQVGNFLLCKLEIPTVFALAAETVLEQAATFRPDVILCIGQAGGRAAVTPERIAVNIRDAKIDDNAGNRPSGERIAEDGPAAYFATVPVKEMAAAMETAGIPATVLRERRYMSFRNASLSARGNCPNTPESARELKSPPDTPTSPSGFTPQAPKSLASARFAEYTDTRDSA